MSTYQLEIKQIVDYPRCRMYREFVQTLIADRSIHTRGCSGLFHFVVLCSYANFRTSYRRLDGISYTIYPGEWICRLSELGEWLRLRTRKQILGALNALQDRNFITYTLLGRDKLVKYSITGWRFHNTVLDYNCPCQKDVGFFFLPVSVASELIGTGKCSEMDVVLDLWLSAIYNDERVQGSDVGPVVYLRNGTGNPLVSYAELAQRWGMSKATVCRILKHLKNMRSLYLLRSGDMMPLILNLPPTSLKPYNDFVNAAFLYRRRPVFGSLVEITLKRKSSNGFDYSVAVFRKVLDFEGDELKQVADYVKTFREQAKLGLEQRAEMNRSAAQENAQIEAGAINIPDNEAHFEIGAATAPVLNCEREDLPA